MDLTTLYTFKECLREQGISEPAAEALARMLPLVTDYGYGFSQLRMARHLERDRKHIRRVFKELEEKGYLRRLTRGIWTVVEERLNGKV